eukprot:gnl/TRDRNA2_/TRDRNA2_178607_c0_seq1.p2 gnl/TRDRNA2_/TRDRNA2_178607_c0~~gnl/TRDRNA2_/TRDRNA2_178607_c0_seq1.p2  ORF type:complete len:255 (+),score=68.72 gnl/TRDRNA2_/TRDRNA2_178607_c0_seq1:79-843(+)
MSCAPPERSLEHMPFKPNTAGMLEKRSEESTGFVDEMSGIATEAIVNQAQKDFIKMNQEAGLKTMSNAINNVQRGVRDEEESLANVDLDKDGSKDDDDDLEALRARRRQQMKAAHEKKIKYQELGHGVYDEIVEEDFLKTVTSSERAVVHFYHREFERCKIMDKHLKKMAPRFMGTRFVTLNAEKAPFFVDKLQIRTLPCVVIFVNGVAVGRQMGFDGLGRNGQAMDDFPTAILAWKIKEFQGIEEDFGPDDSF